VANVVLKHLDKTYTNGCRAVCDLNLEVDDGEFIVLVGPSGCGKSTTLRMIAGLEKPTRGEIWIGDRLVNGVAPSDRDVAMVFQNYALYPHLSAQENIAFGLKMRRMPAAEINRRVNEAAAMLSLESLLGRMPQELSGGERQRVALGRAIVRQPKVFLFDEPLSNLDAQLRRQMRAEIARLHRRLGVTVIYVTHDQEEAMTLGQRLVVLERGIVQQVDAPLSIFRRPTNRFVASFIGSPPMSFIRGQLANGVFKFASGGANGEATARTEISVGSTATGPAVLGLRAEDFHSRGEGIQLGDVVLTVVEHIGHETLAHFTLAGESHIVRLPADASVRPGDRLEIVIRPGNGHLFSEPDGKRLN
jgi:multiple sugar transport system ATP-binding protein